MKKYRFGHDAPTESTNPASNVDFFMFLQVASKLTLKNVAAIIEFSSMFNCEQLFKTCQQFICQNLPSLMHTPLFYSVDYKTLEECEEFYRCGILEKGGGCVYITHRAGVGELRPAGRIRLTCAC